MRPAQAEFFRRTGMLAAGFLLATMAQGQSALPAPDTIRSVATVGGAVISQEELDARIQPELQQLRNQEYEIRRQALDELIEEKLLEAEARLRGVTPEELLQREVTSKVPEITDAEVEAFYNGQKDRINRPLEEIKEQIRQLLRQSREQQYRQAFLDSLRERASISIRLEAPRVAVAPDPNRMRGPANAPVQIVEFSDFQCPFCQKAYPVVRGLLEKYGEKVMLSYRDFPLRNLHGQAQMAAEASRCAGEQGKFWEYHNSLFETPNQLGKEELLLHAATVGVDTEQFRSCLESGRYADAVERDVEAGRQAGVTGTPAFFINGILLSGAQPASVFERTIDAELAAQAAAPPAER
ncbi:MAG TPA: thioredoxin domain-containing protein [Terriglobia bacterium]|nr:thioredoxin domain-containing protein [Terriglobia bacterium]